jgi:lipopolysaccharide transport system ATP-binding protein
MSKGFLPTSSDMKNIIEARNISKKYHLGAREQTGRTFREAVTDALLAPIRNFRDLRRLTRSGSGYPDTIWALKDLSFDVQPGEAVGIIGRNGAGKSTLLKILSRITDPTEGEITLHGRVASLLEVGTGFHPELTGRENIYLNGTILGMRKSEIDLKFDEIVDFSEIDTFLDTPVKRYSSGMYVRLAFAVAAHLDPEILLVDEVLAVGDAAFQKKCIGKMGEVGHQGRTILFVSHNLAAVQSLCTRSIWIDEGTIKMDGPSSSVVSSYLNQGQLTVGKRVWAGGERPGNNSFHLISVSVKNAKGEVTSDINISDPLSVEIEYEIIRPKARAIFSLHLLDENDNLVFCSLSNAPENKYHDVPLVPGRYRSVCLLPGNLLNDRRYHVSLKGLTDRWSDGFFVDHAVSFDGLDDGVLKRDYTGTLGGVVRPGLTWKTVALDGGDSPE